MGKIIVLLIGIFLFEISSFAQSANNILYVIDSIPVLQDPAGWNQVNQDDIADVTIIKNTDSLSLLGWAQMDAVIYIFTKAYRNRPDSMKEIPGLRQMILKNDIWFFHDTVYSGKYIDYYNNGSIQNEGVLLNGRLNGTLTVYFKNSNKKSVTNYKDGMPTGSAIEYYKNGMLMQVSDSSAGKRKRRSTTYFINGQVSSELRIKNATHSDTSITYYSTGKIKDVHYSKNGVFYPDKKQSDLAYYTTRFNQNINTGDLKSANKNFYQVWLLDSTSNDTYYLEGLLLYHEFRYDKAIEAFDKALTIEPLMRESLIYRVMARIKKYKFQHAKPSEKSNKIPFSLEEIELIPIEEQAKVCSDALLADDLSTDEIHAYWVLPWFVVNLCRETNSAK